MPKKTNGFAPFAMALEIKQPTDLDGNFPPLLLLLFSRIEMLSFSLLNLDVGQWCHLNCALWSTEVYETVSGALMSVEQAFKRSANIECVVCKQKGASLSCFFQRCPNAYHFPCAVANGCVFYKNKVTFHFLFDLLSQ